MVLVFAIDDEPELLRNAALAIREAAPEATLRCFARADDALDAIRAGKQSPDIVFCGIELQGVSGLELAAALRTDAPNTKTVFVTGSPQYALDAFRVRAQGYILKPLTPELVRSELDYLPTPVRADRLLVRCFGSFEVFWNGEPLRFGRRQAKELLAYLVDRRGASCTAEEIISALWGEDYDLRTAKQRVRNLVFDLRSTLRQIGMENVLIRQGSCIAIRSELLDCDYYRMLEGNLTVDTFRGEYMANYSWAELTTGALVFQGQT